MNVALTLISLGLAVTSPPPTDEAELEWRALLDECGAVAEVLEEQETLYQMSNPSRPPPEELMATLQRLRPLLETRPSDLEVLLLGARLERLAIRPDPNDTTAPLNMSASHQLLDRVLSLAPTNAEAHYWKARLHGEPVVALERWEMDRQLVYAAENLNAAIEHATEAVEQKPDELRYREALALLLVENGERERAVETLESVAGMENPIIALLTDLASVPLPPGTLPSALSTAFLIFESERALVDRYERLRIAAYVLAGTITDIEVFYASLWPGFKFHTRRASTDGTQRVISARQWIAPENGGWRIAQHAGEVPKRASTIPRGITIDVDEMHNLPVEMLSMVVPKHMLLEPDQIFTRILLTNHRLDVIDAWKGLVPDGWVPTGPPDE